MSEPVEAKTVRGARARVTIADIARKAGVSKGAVSFALNGRPGVSVETRERVLRLADEMGWEPNPAARALTGAAVGAIGLVLDRPPAALGTEAFFNELIAGLQMSLGGAHVSLMVRMVSSEAEELSTYSSWWTSRKVDGVVVIDPHGNDERIELLDRLRLPAVIVGSRSTTSTASSVWMDNSGVAGMLFGYVASLGHPRMAYLSGNAELDHVRARVQVLETTAAERGLTPVSTAGDFGADSAATRTRELLSRPERPTAIVYDNDVMAVAGLNVAREMGVSVPGDLSIASFDDSHVARLVHPSITAIERDTAALGAQAAQLLLDRIGGGGPTNRPGPEAVLRVRESTAPPRR